MADDKKSEEATGEVFRKSSEVDTEEECCDSLYSEDDVMEEDVVVTTPVTPGVSLHYPQGFGRRPHSAMGVQAEHVDLTLPPKSPIPGRVVGKGRQRTFSTSATISTEREPIIRASRRTIYTAGRPPWYDSQGQQVEPFVIGVCGGSASGKTTVANKIISELGVPWVTLLSMDSFYKVLNDKQHELAAVNEYNFDNPDAFDFELLFTTLQRLKEMKKVEVPIYNFMTHRRETKTVSMYGANVIIFEGILAFHMENIRNILDMKVFVETDSDVRLARRLKRDISMRGRDIHGVMQQYENHVKPAYDSYIAPTMQHADIIVPRGGENEVAINLIVQHVQTQLTNRGFKLRSKLAEVGNNGNGSGTAKLPNTLKLLPSTPQIKGLHTYVRNKDTSRDEFIFYSKRLIRLVIEYSLSLLPFQTNWESGEPELYYLRLPKDIKDYQVILMDATVATGAAAMMAIRVLLDHDVPETNINLVSLLMAESGVHTIAYAFPGVKIVTSAVDPEINDKFHVMPGIGNFGDRYFGTEPKMQHKFRSENSLKEGK